MGGGWVGGSTSRIISVYFLKKRQNKMEIDIYEKSCYVFKGRADVVKILQKYDLCPPGSGHKNIGFLEVMKVQTFSKMIFPRTV